LIGTTPSRKSAPSATQQSRARRVGALTTIINAARMAFAKVVRSVSEGFYSTTATAGWGTSKTTPSACKPLSRTLRGRLLARVQNQRERLFVKEATNPFAFDAQKISVLKYVCLPVVYDDIWVLLALDVGLKDEFLWGINQESRPQLH